MKTKKIFSNLSRLEEKLLNIVMPKKCVGCDKEKFFLCSDCLEKIKINSFQVCPICQKSLTEFGEVCRYCKDFRPPLDSLTTATGYEDPLISKSVHLMKYKFIDQLAEPLAEILQKAYRKNKLPIPDIIIPVPLHPVRLRWRGFNQAELLSLKLAKELLPGFQIKVGSEILSRKKFTPAQANLKKSEEREKNVEGAFKADIEKIKEIKNKRVLLIDDICTTGSTLFECGKELRQLKPKSIHALVIARQN